MLPASEATAEGLRSRSSVSALDMQRLLDRLDALESENTKLRDRLNQQFGAEDGSGDFEGAPSFHHAERESGTQDETMFVEMQDGGQAKVVETEKEDPTIECQTVCKFVRPNSASKLNVGQNAQAAMMQQAGGSEE